MDANHIANCKIAPEAKPNIIAYDSVKLFIEEPLLEKAGTESETEMDLETRIRLFDALARLPQPQFEQLLFSLNPPAGIISGGEAPQSNRVSDFLAWMEGPSSTYTLEQVDGMLAELLNRPQPPLRPTRTHRRRGKPARRLPGMDCPAPSRTQAAKMPLKKR